MEDDSNTSPKYSTFALIRDIRTFLRPFRYRFLLATLLRMIGDISRLYPTYVFAQIISLLTKGDSPDLFRKILFLLSTSAVAYLVYIFSRELAKYFGYQVAERVQLNVQLKTLRHLFRLDLIWHERENSGNKLKRMQKGGEGIGVILRIWITNLIEVSVNFVGITYIIATFDKKISLILIGFMIVHYFLSLKITKRAVAMENLVNIGEEKFYGVAYEAVNNIRSVKVLGMSLPLLARVSTRADAVFANIRKRIFWYRTREVVLSIYGNGFMLVMVTFISWGVIAHRYDIGFLVLFFQYFYKIWENVEELSRVTQDFLAAKIGVARMVMTLNEPLIIDAEAGKLDFPVDWKEIEVRHLSFSYSKDNPVLQDISFTIRRGEKIGIVGISGAGKSTLFKLLLKEHERFDGEILIGGVPLKDIKHSSFYRYSAVVLQDTEVFNFKLRDNITLANADRADDEGLLHKAITVAHVANFLEKLPRGLETLIGEKGVKLSGGEKQRVGIARAVFKDPQMLFLDEATSHLDTESEGKIRDSLHRFFQSVTAIVIAHRLSTIKEMDKILVLEKGRIIEAGSFEELYAMKGRFYELWENQKF